MSRVFTLLTALFVVFGSFSCDKNPPKKAEETNKVRKTKKVMSSDSLPNGCKRVADKQIGKTFMTVLSCDDGEKLVVAFPLRLGYNKKFLRAAAIVSNKFVKDSLGKDAFIAGPIRGTEKTYRAPSGTLFKIMAFQLRLHQRRITY